MFFIELDGKRLALQMGPVRDGRAGTRWLRPGVSIYKTAPTASRRCEVEYTGAVLADNVKSLFGRLYVQVMHHKMHDYNGVLFGDIGQFVTGLVPAFF